MTMTLFKDTYMAEEDAIFVGLADVKEKFLRSMALPTIWKLSKSPSLTFPWDSIIIIILEFSISAGFLYLAGKDEIDLWKVNITFSGSAKDILHVCWEVMM